MKVGVLGLQGDVPEHERAVTRADPSAEVILVRKPAHLAEIEALILPGGESTTLAKLLRSSGLASAIPPLVRGGLPVLATCAGLILLATSLEETTTVNPPTLGVLDVRVRRNDYGRQRESFEAPVEIEGLRGDPFPGVFIRAPRILAVGTGAAPLARCRGEIVGVRAESILGLAFHPELSEDPRVHRMLLDMAGARLGQSRKRSRTSPRMTAPSRAATQ